MRGMASRSRDQKGMSHNTVVDLGSGATDLLPCRRCEQLGQENVAVTHVASRSRSQASRPGERNDLVSDSYFRRIKATTPTRLWVNNPTVEEIGLALDQGAVGCTTNPAYAGGLLKRAHDEIEPIIQACAVDEPNNHRAAELVQQRLVARITPSFMPLFEQAEGCSGFVSIQGPPETDTDGDAILREALEGHAISPNATPKIPATVPGFYAFERLVEAGVPTIITEVFSLAQLVYACETYLRVSERTRTRPPFHMSPITGIFNDHLKKVAATEGIDADPRDLDCAGIILGRRCQALVEERSYPVTLLFGGARTMVDFTGLVGAASAATVNYSTVEAILAADPPIEDSIHAPVDDAMVARLNVFEDFRKAVAPRGLEPDEYAAFGPVRHFRDGFVAGWNSVVAAVAEARAATPATADEIGRFDMVSAKRSAP